MAETEAGEGRRGGRTGTEGLPFHGRGAIAHLPRGRIVGLCMLPRVVDLFSRRP
jgi:hypothetical protein